MRRHGREDGSPTTCPCIRRNEGCCAVNLPTARHPRICAVSTRRDAAVRPTDATSTLRHAHSGYFISPTSYLNAGEELFSSIQLRECCQAALVDPGLHVTVADAL